ncbi:MAG: hypothetical protein Kow00106_00820 [Anaerolineae bacterium]
MDSPASRGDQARAAILDAARHLFVTRGYHGTSMRAIAQAAGGRSVAGLYNHFATKEAIFVALIAERNPYNVLFGVLEDALAGALTLADFVHTALREVLRILPQYYDFLQLAQIDLREFGGKNIAHLLRHSAFPRLLDLLHRVQTLPDAAQLDSLVWIRTLASLVLGFLVTEQLAPAGLFGDLNTDEWAERLADIVLYGFLGRHGD